MKRVALITGASRGIGKGIALELARQGYNIAISYKSNADMANDVRAQIERLGARCLAYQADMEDACAPERLVNAAISDFGRIDALVCNAARDARVSVMNISPETILPIMTQLYASQMLTASAAAKRMAEDGIAGCILFITSIHGQMATTDDFLYGGMKAAIERSCKSLALELSPYRIRVNCIAPGAINVRNEDDSRRKYPYADMVPLGRRGGEEDIALAAEFLLSDRAAYITGVTLAVDGGFALPGIPEGWAQAHPVNLEFVKRSYASMLKEREEHKNV